MSDVTFNSGTKEEVAFKLWSALEEDVINEKRSEDDRLDLYAKCLATVKGHGVSPGNAEIL